MPRDSGQGITQSLFRDRGIVVGLQIDPAVCVCTEEDRQTQGGVYRDTAQAMDDLVDAPGWNANGLRQSILADAHGLEPVLQQNLSRVNEMRVSHDILSMVVNNFHVPDVSIPPDEADTPLIIDTKAVLTTPVTFQGFQTITGRYPQKGESGCGVELLQFAYGDPGNIDKTRNPFPLKQPLRIRTSEMLNHGSMITIFVNNVNELSHSFRTVSLPNPPVDGYPAFVLRMQ